MLVLNELSAFFVYLYAVNTCVLRMCIKAYGDTIYPSLYLA